MKKPDYKKCLTEILNKRNAKSQFDIKTTLPFKKIMHVCKTPTQHIDYKEQKVNLSFNDIGNTLNASIICREDPPLHSKRCSTPSLLPIRKESEEACFLTDLKARHANEELKLPPINAKTVIRVRKLDVKASKGEYLMFGIKFKQYDTSIMKDKFNQQIIISQDIELIKEKLEKVNNILRSGITVTD